MGKIDERTMRAVEKLRCTNLEIQIVREIASQTGASPEEALRVYYTSELAPPIERNECGLQFLDGKYLADDVLEHASKATHEGEDSASED